MKFKKNKKWGITLFGLVPIRTIFRCSGNFWMKVGPKIGIKVLPAYYNEKPRATFGNLCNFIPEEYIVAFKKENKNKNKKLESES